LPTDHRLRVLFGLIAEATSFNSQNLTAEEIALRMDPDRFQPTFFYLRQPRPRLAAAEHIRLIQLPARLGALSMAREMIWGKHDLLYYIMPGRASRLYWLLRALGRRKKVLSTIEASADQISALPSALSQEVVNGLGRSDAVVAITELLRDGTRSRFGLQVEEQIIPLGVDLDIFSPADRRGHHPPWKVLFVGSLLERKRPHLLVELARQLRDQPVEFHLIGDALGEGGTSENLRHVIESEGLHQVYLRGSMPPEQVAEQMAGADLFILPSLHEGLPKVTLEAAATGLPTIVFDAYQTPSVVEGETGFQVDSFEALLRRLQQLLKDETLRHRLGAAAVRHVQPFGWDSVALQWQNAMLQLTGREVT
jgi:glycosyltransferase involved in cell wall biosynthesis